MRKSENLTPNSILLAYAPDELKAPHPELELDDEFPQKQCGRSVLSQRNDERHRAG
jgi:hypothetical protein